MEPFLESSWSQHYLQITKQHFVLVCFSVAEIKPDQKQVGEERTYLAYNSQVTTCHWAKSG